MAVEAMGIMVKVLVLPGTFSYDGACLLLTVYRAEPVLPPDQYRSTVVGYDIPLDFDESELSPRLLSWTGMIDTKASPPRSMSCPPPNICCQRNSRLTGTRATRISKDVSYLCHSPHTVQSQVSFTIQSFFMLILSQVNFACVESWWMATRTQSRTLT